MKTKHFKLLFITILFSTILHGCTTTVPENPIPTSKVEDNGLSKEINQILDKVS